MKKPLAILALGLLCALLAGCHGTTVREEAGIPAAFDEAKPVEITFWAKNDTNRTQVDIYERAIANFEALYPNVTVNMRLYTDYGRIYNDVITNIATATTPNVCISYPDHIATYLTGSNVIAELDGLMADENYGLGGALLKFDGPAKDEIVPQFLAECALNGRTCALPYMRSTEACYVNKTMVESLGFELPETLTWDFVWEVSEAAAAKDENGVFLANGQKVMIPFIYKSTDNMMIQMLRQKGAGYSTENGEILIFNDETKEILLDIAEHVKKGAFSTFKISSYPANFLNAGQCVFAVDSTAGATWMGSHAPLSDIPADQFVEFETAVYPVPQYDPAHPQMISQGPSMCLFNKEDSQEVLAGWLFMQYLLTNDVQIAYAGTEGYVPVTTKAQNDPAYIDYLARAGEDNAAHYDIKIKASQLLLAHTGDTFVTPVFNGSTSLRDAAGQMIENVTKAIRRKQTVDSASIDKLYGDMISLYRLNLNGGGAPGAARRDLGPLPGTAVALLAALGAVWLLIGLYALSGALKAKKHRKIT
ncbi:MAG: extracellular solute-binding protein [Clostridia bacterium]|nr:extracellular solute-binding protein [Clostridia bacterium]